MFPFRFSSVDDEDAALTAGADGGRYIAGGTTLVDLMRQNVERPQVVVDINALPYRDIDLRPESLRVGSVVRMSQLAAHPAVRQNFPAITEALEQSASAQLRNMASIGGNLMQRPRCLYFRDVTAACNRRTRGQGCSAIDGHNRTHAILGTSDACVATHPSDLAVALVALDAVVHTVDRDGAHEVPIAEFFRQPGPTPDREHRLSTGGLITAIEVPVTAAARRSGYLKVRDRASFEFALTSAAVALDLSGGRIRAAHVAAGGVGTVPWRLPAVERMLTGEIPSPQLFDTAAALATEGARPLSQNGFKIELLTRTVARQLGMVAGMR